MGVADEFEKAAIRRVIAPFPSRIARCIELRGEVVSKKYSMPGDIASLLAEDNAADDENDGDKVDINEC